MTRPSGPVVPVVAGVLAGVLAWGATLPLLRAVFTDTARGVDMMDESHYVMAAQPWAADKAFNGMFGWYSARLLDLVGQDLARLRVLAGLILVLVASVLARSLRRAAEQLGGNDWPRWLRAIWPPAVVSAALCYYTVFVRTPSYNWFASVGVMLVAAGLLGVVAARPQDRPVLPGVLLAAGAFVTAVGKATTAVGATGIALLAVIVHVISSDARRRRQVVVAASAAAVTAVVLAGGHLVFVHGPAFTLATYRRVGAMLAIVDPAHYASDAVLPTARHGLSDILIVQPRAYLSLLALPVLAAATPLLGVRRPPGWALAGAYLVVVAVPVVMVVRAYPGGVAGLAMSTPPLVVAALGGVLVAVVAEAWQRRAAPGPPGERRPHPRTALLLAVALTGMALSYPFGTNVSYSSQLHGGFVILLVAAAVGVCGIPDRGHLPALAALVVGAVVLGGVLVPVTRQVSPWRMASLDHQTFRRSLVPGTPPLLVDRETADWLDALRERAAAGGWEAGGPMLDLTWHPGAVLALGGRAPRVLIPSFPGLPTPGASAAYALSQEDPTLWRQAWVFVLSEQSAAVADQATSVLGLRFPSDYQLVGEVTAPFDGQRQGLWKPR